MYKPPKKSERITKTSGLRSYVGSNVGGVVG
jgi:hypothetical protein